jgi:membrane-associated phospholipid phosphatase
MRLRRPAFSGRWTPVVRREHVTLRLVLVGAVAGLLTVPIWWATTQTTGGQRIADLILYGHAAADPGTVAASARILGFVSISSAAVATACLGMIAWVRGGLGLALAVLAIVGGANVTAQVLKSSLDRPDLLGQLAFATGNSFPSGTVTLVAAAAFAAILLAPRRLRTWIAVLASMAVAATAISAIVLTWHRLADVVAAVLISLAWASLVTAVLVLLQGRMPRRTWGRGRGGAVTGLVASVGGLAILAGLVALSASLLDGRALDEAITTVTDDPTTFAAALVVSAGTSLIAYAAFVWGLRGVALEHPA